MVFSSDLSVGRKTTLAGPDWTDARISLLVFGRDGTSFFAAGSRADSSFVSLVRRLDGSVLVWRNLPRGVEPRTLTPTKDARTLIFTASQSGAGATTISLLSTDSLTERSQLARCGGHPGGVALLPDLDRAYIRCNGEQAVLVEIDLALGRAVRTAVLDQDADPPCGSGGVALSPSKSLLLAPCSSGGTLLYLDRLRLTVFDSLPAEAGASAIAVSPRSPVALVTFPDSDAVALVDLVERAIVTRIATVGRPDAVAISGDGRIGYMLVTEADEGPGSVARIDLQTGEVLNSVAVPPGSRSLTLWPGEWSPRMLWR